MEVRPVKTYRRPQYPQKTAVGRDPSLLRRIPHRWAKNTAVLTALGMTLTFSACSNGVSPAPAGSAAPQTPAGSPTPANTPAMVAPIFEHGGGSGSFGCVSVVAPYFLSEEEAYEIIRTEAQEYGGLSFSQDAPELTDVVLPETYIDAWPESAGESVHVVQGNAPAALQLDGGAGGGIAFEFVSAADLRAWEWTPGEDERATWCSVGTYDFRNTAQTLRDALAAAQTDTSVGVFYDPAAGEGVYEQISAMQMEMEAAGEVDYAQLAEQSAELWRQSSEENLRAQVRDFIDWLKGQGIV